jgi:hypothetical protein
MRGHDVSSGAAFRAWAAGGRPKYELAARFARHSTQRFQDSVAPAFSNPVEDVPPVTPILNEAGLAKYLQMLRDVGLAQSKRGLQMTDTLLTVAQGVQDRQAQGVAEGPAQRGSILVKIDCRSSH